MPGDDTHPIYLGQVVTESIKGKLFPALSRPNFYCNPSLFAPFFQAFSRLNTEKSFSFSD